MPGDPDKAQAANIRQLILSVAAWPSLGRFDQADSFVVSDHPSRNAGSMSRLADVHGLLSSLLCEGLIFFMPRGRSERLRLPVAMRPFYSQLRTVSTA